MSRDVKVDDASSIVCQYDKDEQYFKPDSVDSEEIDGSEVRNVIAKERPPRL
jgi:hypothetical protein